MNDLVPAIIMAIIAYAIYRLFELFVRRPERMAIIEKLSSADTDLKLNNKLDVNISNKSNVNWPLRIGALFVGIGLGATIAAIVDLCTESIRESYSAIGSLYMACIFLFGGMGLIAAYIIEKKYETKDNGKNENQE